MPRKDPIQIRYGSTIPVASDFIMAEPAWNSNRLYIKNISGVMVEVSGFVITKRITSGDSPYTILGLDNNVFCDTDGGAITLNMPAGINGRKYRFINTGSSGNAVTITPNGAELLMGVNSSFTLLDGDVLILVYETTEGWW